MTDPNFLLLYVADVAASVAFWSNLLGRPPIERSDTFAMLALRDGVMLGLWKIDGVEPPTGVTGGGTEIAFTVATREDVDKFHTDWSDSRRTILQPPTDMDFGRTFTAADPDGHRIRVFCSVG
jgi:catechol 2,3-dioxygenase-like lactoylglutathione lyase family enzyme